MLLEQPLAWPGSPNYLESWTTGLTPLKSEQRYPNRQVQQVINILHYIVAGIEMQKKDPINFS